MGQFYEDNSEYKSESPFWPSSLMCNCTIAPHMANMKGLSLEKEIEKIDS